jgi:Na+/H+ antiporter NhaD/arsenite permease-like protein
VSTADTDGLPWKRRMSTPVAIITFPRPPATLRHRPEHSATDANLLTLTPLFLAAAWCATLSTPVLPRPTGWLACVAALLGLGSAPAIYGGKNFLAHGSGPGR